MAYLKSTCHPADAGTPQKLESCETSLYTHLACGALSPRLSRQMQEHRPVSSAVRALVVHHEREQGTETGGSVRAVADFGVIPWREADNGIHRSSPQVH